MNRLKRFQYWLGSPAGAAWYFGTFYILFAAFCLTVYLAR
jgi:hypothetical protein